MLRLFLLCVGTAMTWASSPCHADLFLAKNTVNPGVVASIVASRASGVAPLNVFFDATASKDPGRTTRPFHELDYSWNFGDPSAGTWSTGSVAASKNIAYGPVAAHLYTTPGVYTVTLTVNNGATTDVKTHVVTVTDPVGVFPATATDCVSATGTFTDCPVANANHITSSDFGAQLSRATAGRQILFRRGESFTNATASMTVSGAVGILGAYGTGNRPVITNSQNGDMFVLTGAVTDWRIAGLEFDLGGLDHSRFMSINAYSGAVNSVLFYDNIIRHGGNGIITSGNAPPCDIDDMGFVENQFSDLNYLYTQNNGTAVYSCGTRITYQGNLVQTTLSHMTRWPWLQKAAFTHNTHNWTNGVTCDRQAFKIHASSFKYITADVQNGSAVLTNVSSVRDEEGTLFTAGAGGSPGLAGSGATINETYYDGRIAAVDEVGATLTLTSVYTGPTGSGKTFSVQVWAGNYTQQLYFGQNRINSNGCNSMIVYWPQDNHSDERLRDAIFEANHFVWTEAVSSWTALQISADDVTIRNNVFDAHLSEGAPIALMLGRWGTCRPRCEPIPHRIQVLNNTFYSLQSGAGTQKYIYMQPVSASNAGLVSNSTSYPLYLHNNLAYQPGSTGSPLLWTPMYSSIGLTETAQNSTTAQIKSSNPFTVVSPATLDDFIPDAGGYAAGAGVVTPGVFRDFYSNLRGVQQDLGAFKLGSTPPP